MAMPLAAHASRGARTSVLEGYEQQTLSSFLDELLGRLAAENPRGQEIFEGPACIQGMNPTVQAMANVVVAQRLGQQISG